jgi:hypothetical protein
MLCSCSHLWNGLKCITQLYGSGKFIFTVMSGAVLFPVSCILPLSSHEVLQMPENTCSLAALECGTVNTSLGILNRWRNQVTSVPVTVIPT